MMVEEAGTTARDCGKVVLVVEDDDNLCAIICDLLQDAGFKVCPAADGSEAMTALERCGKNPCVILLDLMTPGVDGWTFRKWQLASAHAAVPVVVLSAVRDVAGEAAKLNAAGFVAKPVKLDALLAWVERYCGSAGGQGGVEVERA